MLNVNESLEMNLICMVAESKDCRDGILLSNVVWDDTVDRVPDLGCLGLVDATLEVGTEADKTDKEGKWTKKSLATTTTTTTTNRP